jgi:YbgC/YbaW family acyl-CoA thioester hydrolase
MSAAPFVAPIRVRFVDTDASGRIHFSAAMRYFEAAEAEFLRARGHGYTAMLASEYLYPRVHVECDYTGAIVCDDLLEVAVTVERIGNASYRLGFAASVEGRPVLRGAIVAACMDRRSGRSAPLPEPLKRALRGGD